MEPVLAVLPEFEGRGRDPPATPPRGPLDLAVDELGRPPGHLRRRARRGRRPWLWREARAPIWLPGPGWRSRRRTPRRRPARPCPRSAPGGPSAPSRRAARLGIGRQLAALAAVVVGVEDESVGAPRLEQHHPHRGSAVGSAVASAMASGSATTAAASSNQRPNCASGSGSTVRSWSVPSSGTASGGVGSMPRPYRRLTGPGRRRGARRAGRPLAFAGVTGPIDVDAERAATPGCATVAHLNNAGAALPTAATVETMVDHLRLESERGGYEAASAGRPTAGRRPLLGGPPPRARCRRGGGDRFGHPGMDQGPVGVRPGRRGRRGPDPGRPDQSYDSHYLGLLQVCG